VSRAELIGAITERIGKRQLLWFGTRGEDGAPLLALPQFSGSFSLTAPSRTAGLRGRSLEELKRRRVDLDQYEPDDDDSEAMGELRRQMLGEMNRPTVVVSYRPSRLVSALEFANLETVVHAGLFRERHLPFEHKPWVESNVAALGVPTVEWRYVADERHTDVLRYVHDGPVMLRTSRGSGGVGLVRLDHPDDLDRRWLRQAEAFLSVAPYLDNAVPINVGAVAFPTGDVTVHAASVQLIGIPACIDRPFGYCGNDFGAIRDLGDELLGEIERRTKQVGGWLARQGFLGAFGVDFLLSGDALLFSEINPRFQGSSFLATELERSIDQPDIYLDHIAAHLGVLPAGRPSLVDLHAALPAWSQVVVHSDSSGTVRRVAPVAPPEWADDLVDVSLVPEQAVDVDPAAVLCRLFLSRSVTKSGFELDADAVQLLAEMRQSFGGRELP